MGAMRALVLVWTVLAVGAGCDNAVVIEVTPAPGVATDTVELYVGLARCGDCPGIRPPSANTAASSEPLPGAVFYREDSHRATITRSARVEDGVARFRIEASEVGDQIALAVAVDANGQSAAVIPSLSLDQAGIYKVTLQAASPSPLGPKPPATSGSFVAIWRQPTGEDPCMGFEHWRDGALVGERVFIVPADDLDCDEASAQNETECNPYAYDGQGVPAIEDARCTTAASTASDEATCRLGGLGCDDATGQAHDCLPSDYCLPGVYCDPTNPGCAGIDQPFDLATCLFKTPLSPRLVCTVPFRSASAGHGEPCGSVPFEVPAVAAGLSCLGPYDDLMLARPAAGANLAFSSTATIVTGEDVGARHELRLRARFEGHACRYKLEVDGELAPSLLGLGELPERTFVQLWVQREGGLVRKLLVPLAVRAVRDDACTGRPLCSFEIPDTDALASCARL